MSDTLSRHEAAILESPLLAKLPRTDLLALASRARLSTYAAKDVIFRQGDEGDSLLIIVEGLVRIVMVGPNGGEKTVALLSRGDCFGELAALDGRPRSASALAAAPTVLLVVARADLRSWLSGHPPAAFALLETLSLRFRRTNESLVEIAFSDLEHRLARQLLRLPLAVDGGATQEAQEQRVKITQAELASLLGVSRETINKQLRVFVRRGLIRVRRGSIALTRRQALRQLAEG